MSRIISLVSVLFTKDNPLADFRLFRSLAYAEMRLILARLIWNFDMTLAENSKGWYERNQVYLLWEKGPVNVVLVPRDLGSGQAA